MGVQPSCSGMNTTPEKIETSGPLSGAVRRCLGRRVGPGSVFSPLKIVEISTNF